MTIQQLLMIRDYLEEASKGYVIGNKQLIILSLENALEIVNKEIEKEYTIDWGVLKMTDQKRYGISKELADKIDKEYNELFASDNAKLGFKSMTEDRPTLIYYVQTVLNTFKRDIEQGFITKDKQYAIELLEKAMEYQNNIWNDAIEEAAKCYNDWGEGCTQDIGAKIRELKK